MSKHTPGKWETDDNFVFALNDDGTNRFSTMVSRGTVRNHGRFSDWERTTQEEVAANARLIAAAPELLDALKAAVADLESLATAMPALTNTVGILVGKAAIAKAEGK